MQNTQPNPQKSSKTQAIILISLVVVSFVGFMICYIIFFISALSVGNTKSSNFSNGELAGGTAKVGDYRYVNACNAMPSSKYQEVFGYPQSVNTPVIETHAEGSRTEKFSVISECTTTFAYVPQTNGNPLSGGDRGVLTVNIDQYKDGGKASENLDIDAKNNTSATTGSFQQQTVGDTKVLFNSDTKTFEFAHRNALVKVTVSPSTSYRDSNALTMGQKYTENVAAKLVPVVMASIDNDNLSQKPIASPDQGKPIGILGSAYVLNPCESFSSATFKTVTNTEEDDTEVSSIIPMNPVTYAPTVKQLDYGRDSASCTRVGYNPKTQPLAKDYGKDYNAYLAAQKAYDATLTPSLTANYLFYNSADEAIKGGDARVSNVLRTAQNVDTKPINGVGDRALLISYDVDASANLGQLASAPQHETHLYVIRGAYLIDIMLEYLPGPTADQSTARAGSEAEYTKAGQLLATHL